MEKIICSAIHFLDGEKHVHQPKNIESGFVVTGRRHHNCFATISILANKNLKNIQSIQGFLTSEDRFLNREESLVLAKEAGQIKDLNNIRGNGLFSEDLY